MVQWVDRCPIHTKDLIPASGKLGVMVHACNPSVQEAGR